MVLAAAPHQRTIGIIQIKEAGSLVRGGLAGVAAIPLRLLVRKKGNWHPCSLITKGGTYTRKRGLEKAGVIRVYTGDHKGTPI